LGDVKEIRRGERASATRPGSADPSRKTNIVRPAIVCAVLLCSLASSRPLHAQRAVDFAHSPGWLAGYVVNAPQQMLGVGAFAIPSASHRWGVYADAKFRLDSPGRRTLDRDRSPAEAEALGDTHFKDDAAWTSVNLAVVRGFTSDLAAYVGGGVSWRTLYVQYLDDTMERGELGQYWVIDDDFTGAHPNFLGGVFFRATPRVVFQFGGEAAPVGVTVGVHVLLR
jgi:hypothetical protein